MDEGKELLKNLGNHIAVLRKKKKISQTELGYLCNLDRQAMWRIEAGKTNPTTLTLARICKALNIPIQKIFEFND